MLDSSPKVTRKPTICFRGASSQQNSFDEQNPPAEILYENEAETEFPNGGGKIQDRKCLVIWKYFKRTVQVGGYPNDQNTVDGQ